MASDELEEFRHLWDGSEEWVLHAYHHSDTEIRIVFGGETPTTRELLAVRKLLTEYREMPMHQAKALIGHSKSIALKTMSTFEAQPHLKRAEELGLPLVAEGASYTVYIPFSQTSQSSLRIEGADLAKRVAQKMLEEGVTVTSHIEVD